MPDEWTRHEMVSLSSPFISGRFPENLTAVSVWQSFQGGFPCIIDPWFPAECGQD